MNRIIFDTPMHIEEVKKEYNLRRVSLYTTPNMFPLIKGVSFIGEAVDAIEKRKAFPIRRKMDSHIESYQNAMRREWDTAKKKLSRVKGVVEKLSKMGYNNEAVIKRIVKLPTKNRKALLESANKYGLDLALLDRIVVNQSLMVNARYDNRKNLIEMNLDYLKQHGMIRIGDEKNTISETDKTFIHEFGHVVYYQVLSEADKAKWSSLATFLERDELIGDMKQYIVGEKKRFDGSTFYSPVYTLRDELFVSIYARFNEREDFAESFLYYKVAPETLKRTCPKKYKFIAAVVGSGSGEVEKVLGKQKIGEDAQGVKVKVEDRVTTRQKIITALYALKDSLAYKAKEHMTNVYNLGRQKGAYYVSKPYSPKLEVEDKEKIKTLVERNDVYLDEFMDELTDEFDNVLFEKNPDGTVIDERMYDDPELFDEMFNDVMDTQEHRLALYAINGLTLALMAGMTGEVKDVVGGGYWHTVHDNGVCDGCKRLDGKWMSFEEFEMEYGHNECDGNCRCGELFEPKDPPEILQNMQKGGAGSGNHGHKGVPGEHGGSAGGDGAKSSSSGVSEREKIKHKALGSIGVPYAERMELENMMERHEGLREINPRVCYDTVVRDAKKLKDPENTMVFLSDVTRNMKQADHVVLVGKDGKVLSDTYKHDFFSRGDDGSMKYIKSYTDSKGKEQTTYDEYAPYFSVKYGDFKAKIKDVVKKMVKSEEIKKKIAAIDYHGTIMVNDKPNIELVDKMKEMREKGYHIIVYTSGITESPGSMNGIREFLDANDIPYDEVWARMGKPDADIYIDDKAVNPNKENISTMEV